MKILCVFGQYNYGVSFRGIGYEYANFIPAIKNLGHEVVFFESLNKSSYQDYLDLNKKLLEVVEREKPEFIFCVLMGYEIWIETFEFIRKISNAILIHWATDDSWKYEQFSRYMASQFNIYATTYPSAIAKSKEDGYSNFYLTQWAANSANFNGPTLSKECIYDVSFIGTCYGNRKSWIDELQKHGIKVNCFGHGWPGGPIEAEQIPLIINQSKISLNFGDSGLMVEGGKIDRNRQIKARVFEVPGAGGLLMTEAAEHLEEFYSIDEEIVVFDGIDDLVIKINMLLDNSDTRDRIAKSGFNRTVQEHSYEHRFERLIEKAIDSKVERKKNSCSVNMAYFEKVTDKHKIGVGLRMFKLLILLPCVLIWGKERGPRAARRFLFEISWRVFGRKTYTAAGLPGRLFYKSS